jgi:hypothetical protein
MVSIEQLPETALHSSAHVRKFATLELSLRELPNLVPARGHIKAPSGFDGPESASTIMRSANKGGRVVHRCEPDC